MKPFRSMLKIRQFDHHWTLPSRMDDSPTISVVEVTGFMTDIARCPRVLEEIALERDLIPYIPGDREDGTAEESTMSHTKNRSDTPGFQSRTRSGRMRRDRPRLPRHLFRWLDRDCHGDHRA